MNSNTNIINNDFVATLQRFLLEFKYLDFINDKRFGSKEVYDTFLNVVDFLINNGIAGIKDVNGFKTLYFDEKDNFEEKLKNVFKSSEEVKEFKSKIDEINNHFFGYEFDTFLNNCKFAIILPDGNLKIFFPDGFQPSIDKKVGKIISDGRKEEVVKSIYNIFGKYGGRLEKIREIETAYTLIKQKYNNAEIRYHELVELFITRAIETIDRIVDDEKLLLAYDNAIYLDEKRGIFSISRDTILNILKKIREEHSKKTTLDTIFTKIGAPVEEKDLRGIVVKVYGDSIKVSKVIYEIHYTNTYIRFYKKFIGPLKRKIEERKDELSLFSDDVKEVILE